MQARFGFLIGGETPNDGVAPTEKENEEEASLTSREREKLCTLRTHPNTH